MQERIYVTKIYVNDNYTIIYGVDDASESVKIMVFATDKEIYGKTMIMDEKKAYNFFVVVNTKTTSKYQGRQLIAKRRITDAEF